MRAILRPVVEHLLGDSTVVEVVYRDQVVATVIGGESPCVTVVSSHPMWVMDPREMTPRIGPPAPDYGDAGPIGIEVHIDPPAPVEPPTETTLAQELKAAWDGAPDRPHSTLVRAAAAVRRYRRRELDEVAEEGEAD